MTILVHLLHAQAATQTAAASTAQAALAAEKDAAIKAQAALDTEKEAAKQVGRQGALV